MKKKRLVILLVILALTISGAMIYFFGFEKGGIRPFAATTSGTFALSPSTRTVNVGESFNVDIIANTGGVDTDAAQAIITFDTNFLSVVDADSATAGTQLTKGSFYPNTITNSAEGGKIVFEGTSDLSSATPINGTGTLATIRFTALKSGTAQVNFTFQPGANDMDFSAIVSHGDYSNVLASVTNGTYTLGGGAQNVTVDIKADSSDGPVSKVVGQQVRLSWVSQNANSCNSSWAGAKSTGGSEIINNLTATQTYTLTCQGSGGSVSDSVKVNVAGSTSGGNTGSTTGGTTGTTGTTSTTTRNTTSRTSNPNVTSTPPQQVSNLPTNIQPTTMPQEEHGVELYQNATMKPWVLWFLYAIIPAFITGGAIYYYLKRRKKNQEESQQAPGRIV